MKVQTELSIRSSIRAVTQLQFTSCQINAVEKVVKYVMKNIESFPPLKAIELANKKLPEIWAAIEKARADMLSTGHNPWREDIYTRLSDI